MLPQNSNRHSTSSSQMIGSDTPESFPSPNAIPPRVSSNGIHSPGASPAKSALKPLSEASWMSQSLGPAAETPAAKQYTHRRETSTPVLSEALGSTWSTEKEKIVLGPYQYLVEIPGKDIRRQLIESFNEWLKVPPQALEIITDAVTMLHTASLLIDDVEDSSLLRRGSPVAHSIFGIPQTLNSANYVYFKALETLFKLKNPAVIQIYSEELCNLHRGQGMDLFWRDTLTVPTEDDYLEMVGNKTGGLFRLAIKLMQAESTNTEVKDCAELVNLIGLIFQIRDDYMNLWSKDYTANKGLCEDLTEGKFSFPVIHAIRANESNRVLINILKQKTQDDTVKMYAVQYLESMGSFEYSRKTIRKLSDKAFAMIEELDAGKGEGEKLKKIVARFTALE